MVNGHLFETRNLFTSKQLSNNYKTLKPCLSPSHLISVILHASTQLHTTLSITHLYHKFFFCSLSFIRLLALNCIGLLISSSSLSFDFDLVFVVSGLVVLDHAKGGRFVDGTFFMAPCVVPLCGNGLWKVVQPGCMLGRRENPGEHEAMRRMKNEFMVNWDGLRTKDTVRVLVLIATNRPYDLDRAVIRRLPLRLMNKVICAIMLFRPVKEILEKEKSMVL
ncbi:unnamed protein product [Vicia faba]|uniref:ATPase AAA-type core domain-containing protein n=1 Tax=Vicia faba TaxID=3906 RepID=A0AAV0YF63_VICFA|nr:unnamed protein product [Vicia faba]